MARQELAGTPLYEAALDGRTEVVAEQRMPMANESGLSPADIGLGVLCIASAAFIANSVRRKEPSPENRRKKQIIVAALISLGLVIMACNLSEKPSLVETTTVLTVESAPTALAVTPVAPVETAVPATIEPELEHSESEISPETRALISAIQAEIKKLGLGEDLEIPCVPGPDGFLELDLYDTEGGRGFFVFLEATFQGQEDTRLLVRLTSGKELVDIYHIEFSDDYKGYQDSYKGQVVGRIVGGDLLLKPCDSLNPDVVFFIIESEPAKSEPAKCMVCGVDGQFHTVYSVNSGQPPIKPFSDLARDGSSLHF